MLTKEVKTIFEFSHATKRADKPGVYLIGFEFDGTACFRKGTRLGPNALRDISYGLESFSSYQKLDLENFSNFFDAGNIELGNSNDVDEQWKQGTDNFISYFKDTDLSKMKALTVGGEHSISFAPIKLYLEQFDNLVLIHLDAHADLRDGYEGHHYSHASIIRRALDHFKDGHQLIQYGIRSGTKQEFDWMQENKTRCESRADFLGMVNSIPDDRPIYLTLDLDYFDPSFFPGTGTPEAGGEDFHSFIKLIKILKRKNFVGADAVELSPELDPTGNSAIFASKIVRELALSLLQER